MSKTRKVNNQSSRLEFADGRSVPHQEAIMLMVDAVSRGIAPVGVRASSRWVQGAPEEWLAACERDRDDPASRGLLLHGVAITLRAWETRSASISCCIEDVADWAACLKAMLLVERMRRQGILSCEQPPSIFRDLDTGTLTMQVHDMARYETRMAEERRKNAELFPTVQA